MRLAVVADVNTPLQPGLFQSAVTVMNAWARTVNEHGGIAGRRVVIDFIDSQLNPNDTRNAIIRACAQDFAMVGGEALFMNNVDDMVACKDARGNAVGLPDLPGLAIDSHELCSPVTFVDRGDASFCATQNDHPQTYTVQQGDYLYYLRLFKDLHGIFLAPGDIQSTRIAEVPFFQAGINAGIKKDGAGVYNTSALAPQSALSPLVAIVKANNSTFVYGGNTYGTMVLFRREAKLQGVNSVRVWACNEGCYDTQFTEQGGSDVDGQYSWLNTLPFYSEYKLNPSLAALVRLVGGPQRLNDNGLESWVAALLFQDAAGRAVANGGTLDRQSLLAALATEHNFTAQGIIAPTDVAAHTQPRCFVLAQVRNGIWVRAYPSKPGTFACSTRNVVQVKTELAG